jgi:hypothetical protein
MISPQALDSVIETFEGGDPNERNRLTVLALARDLKEALAAVRAEGMTEATYRILPDTSEGAAEGHIDEALL